MLLDVILSCRQGFGMAMGTTDNSIALTDDTRGIDSTFIK